ncbi:MAG: hypothetical protein PG981_000514 [Wolbachia endosymbiont of Ctenocephalides orientis wCori]|nr:MAG: hypothetical protein PG981_000514 [Wolbachia endosymbiont of Ctenocephalides orientis wCori]
MNRYNCTALEYARKLGTDEIKEEIEKKIENGIYKHSVLLYKVKFLLKASPHIAKALIVTELDAILVASIIGSLSTLLILYATFAISIPLYLLNKFIYKNCVTNRYFDKRKEILLCGLGSLYYIYLMAGIYCGKGYFFAS